MTTHPVVKVVQSEAVQKSVVHVKVIGRSIATIAFFSLQADAIGAGEWELATILRNVFWAAAVYHMVVLTGYTLSVYLLYTAGQPLSDTAVPQAGFAMGQPKRDAIPPVTPDGKITMNRQAFNKISQLVKD